MTIAITLKVNDGVVVASDSATTMDFGAEGNVYNHADKLFTRAPCQTRGR
jgi:20S proteasome alpha/beta subunit